MITTDLLLTFGTNEDKTWNVSLNGFSLTDHTLKSEIRDEAGTLVGSFTVSVTSDTTFTVTTTGNVPAGEYVSDILATSTVTGKKRYITGVFKVAVIDRVTAP